MLFQYFNSHRSSIFASQSAPPTPLSPYVYQLARAGGVSTKRTDGSNCNFKWWQVQWAPIYNIEYSASTVCCSRHPGKCAEG